MSFLRILNARIRPTQLFAVQAALIKDKHTRSLPLAVIVVKVCVVRHQQQVR